MTETIGIIGVGLMGHGIATNVQRKGNRIAFLRHPGNQPTAALEEAGAAAFDTAGALARACETIILCVTGSPQVEAVLTGPNGVLEGLRPGAVVIDCSTALPHATRAMAALVEAAGGKMIDAPMTRTPKEAAEGRLNLLVGGDPAIYERKLALLKTFAENVTYAGEIGSGHALKLLHNYVSLGFSTILCETAAAARHAGIEPEVLHKVLAQGGGGGVVLDRLAPFMLGGDVAAFRFSIANAAKDLDYYAGMVENVGGADTVARSVRDTYRSQVEDGNGARFVPELIDLLG